MRRIILVLSFILSLAALPAHADGLADAKASGELGERIDGYLGTPPNASGSASALAGEINAKRKASYAEIAGKRNVSVDAVAAIAGKKLLEKASPGEWIMDAAGWRRK